MEITKPFVWIKEEKQHNLNFVFLQIKILHSFSCFTLSAPATFLIRYSGEAMAKTLAEILLLPSARKKFTESHPRSCWIWISPVTDRWAEPYHSTAPAWELMRWWDCDREPSGTALSRCRASMCPKCDGMETPEGICIADRVNRQFQGHKK